MELRQLEIFLKLADCGSFSLAAQQLHLSQPTISAHLHALEQELNVQLIRRTTRLFALTQAGEKLYRHAQRLLALRDEALGELTGEQHPTLRIGASSVPGQYLLPEALARFQQRMPAVRLHITCTDSADVSQQVADGLLDVGLVGTKADVPLCSFFPIAWDELVLVTPDTPRYRAFQQHDAPFTELLQEPLLLRSDRSGTRQEAERFLATQGMAVDTENILLRVDDAQLLRRCVAQGLGVSILSRRAAEEWTDRLLLFPLPGGPWRRALYLVCREDPYRSRAVSEWIRLLKESAPDPED